MLVKFVQQAEDDAKKWLVKAEQEKERELLEECMMGLMQYTKGFFLCTTLVQSCTLIFTSLCTCSFSYLLIITHEMNII